MVSVKTSNSWIYHLLLSWILLTLVRIDSVPETTPTSHPDVSIKTILQPCIFNGDHFKGKVTGHTLRSCTRGLLVYLKIKNRGTTITKDQVVLLNSAYDARAKKTVKLSARVAIKFSQEKVLMTYPLKYLFSVNNKPYELVIDRGKTQNFTGCLDSKSLVSVCGTSNGRVQGFCCPCGSGPSLYGDSRTTKCETPGQVNDSRSASAHCLKLDPMWYSVYQLESPVVHHVVHVQVYMETNQPGNTAWKDWTMAKQIRVGTHHPRNSSTSKMVVVQYKDLSDATDVAVYPRIEKRLLIPQTLTSTPRHVQLQGGADEYLLLSTSAFNPNGTKCDKIGVSSAGFIEQSNRCDKPPQSCLDDQPLDLWLRDKQRKLVGESPMYFLSEQGVLARPAVAHDRMRRQSLLRLEHRLTHLSQLDLYIEADDFVPVSNMCIAEIVKILVVSKEKHTGLKVYVRNTGVTSAAYSVSLRNCSYPQHDSAKLVRNIDPYDLGDFVFQLAALKDVATATCLVEVQDTKGKNIASRPAYFRPLDRCFCIGFCRCKCASDKDLSCNPMTPRGYTAAGFLEHMPEVTNMNMSSVWAVEIVPILGLTFLFCGIVKAVLGIAFSVRMGNMGLCVFFETKQRHYYEPHLSKLIVVHNDKGEPIHPDTGQDVRRMPLGREILINSCFFFLLPLVAILLLVNICLQKVAERKKQPKEDLSFTPLLKTSELEREILPSPSGSQWLELDKKSAMKPFLNNKEHLSGGRYNVEKQLSDLTDVIPGQENSRVEKTQLSTNLNIDELIETERAIYYNFRLPNSHLKNSGNRFSLCGCLQKVQKLYKFTIHHYQTQVFENTGGKIKSLTTLLPIKPKFFERLLTFDEVQEHITLTPLYPCLNRVI